MNLSQFKSEESLLLSQFHNDWKKKAEANPEKFPSEMRRHDWIYHFQCWKLQNLTAKEKAR